MKLNSITYKNRNTPILDWKSYSCCDSNGMGNILTQERHNRNGDKFDDLTYRYQKDGNGNLQRNRLYHVNDAVSAGLDSTDIDDMGAFVSAVNQINTDNNYSYDAEGRLVKDKQEEIDTILWTVTGKVREIHRIDTSKKKNLVFDYDAFGRRIAKHIYSNETSMLEKSTYYILDASGNQLSIYEHKIDTVNNAAVYYLMERNIYGSSRLGVANDTVNMFNPVLLPSYGIVGNRNYELNNHLGNVLTVINDIKYPISDDNNTIDNYEVGISNIFDYSPFGAPLDGRTITRKLSTQICHDSTIVSTQTVFNETFDSWGNWTATGSAVLTYISGEMQVTNPNVSKNNIGASKNFTTGSAVLNYIASFDITDNSCANVQLWPPSSTPIAVDVYIKDNANNVVASGAYTTAGNYNLSFTPTTSGASYTIEFYMTNASALCFFAVDNVLITYQDTDTIQICKNVSREGNYRYQFQNQEVDDEIKGKGNSVNFEFRMHDPRLGRWLTIDPMAGKYPYLSPYSFVANSPLMFIDPDGRDIVVPNKEDRAAVLKMINSKALGLYAFDKNGKLYQVRSTGDASRYSKYYADKLNKAIKDKDIINIKISQKYTSGDKKKDVDIDAGGGITQYSIDKSGNLVSDVNVTISGNEYKNLKDQSGKPLEDKPADILAHELVGHAIPATVESDTGNAVDNENKVREEVKKKEQTGSSPLRKKEPMHEE